MTAEDELYAEASAIVQARGEDAERWVAERTVALNLQGDEAGMRRYRELAVRVAELLSRPADQPR